MVISYSFPFFHPYVSFFFFFLLFFLHHKRIPIYLHPLLFYLYFPLDSKASLSLSPLLLCLPFCFYFLSSSAHFTHTANHDLLTSLLCLHFCFLFSFFFISLHSHTQPAERLAFISTFHFLFLPSFLVLIHFVVTMELR